jgi:hypothetical protein
MKTLKEAALNITALRRALNLVLPLLKTFRATIVDSYATEDGDVASISKKEKEVLALIKSLDKAIRSGERVLAKTAPRR